MKALVLGMQDDIAKTISKRSMNLTVNNPRTCLFTGGFSFRKRFEQQQKLLEEERKRRQFEEQKQKLRLLSSVKPKVTYSPHSTPPCVPLLTHSVDLSMGHQAQAVGVVDWIFRCLKSKSEGLFFSVKRLYC